MAEKLINKKYKVTAQILTPLHIGAGSEKDWVEGMDYLLRDGMLWHLDMNKMIEAGIDVNRMADLFVSGNAQSVDKLVGAKLQQVSDFHLELPASSDNPIHSFLRNQLSGNPILAGSSLKGAIRSVLFNYLRDEEKRDNDVFGKINDGSNFMRYVRLSDIEFKQTELVNTKIYNLFRDGQDWSGGWKHNLQGGNNPHYKPNGFNTIYDCLVPTMSAEGTALFADTLFAQFSGQQPKADKKNEIMKSRNIANAICDIINNHTFEYLNKEAEFFDEYSQGEYAQQIIKSIDQLQDIIDECNDNECVIKMSAGAGFHSITGDWQFDDYTNTGEWEFGRNAGKKKYKSRKIAICKDAFALMGFVKLTFTEE